MRFTTKSGNTYQYDRYSNKIGLTTPGDKKPLETLTFEPVPAVNRLSNLSTFIVEFTRDCNLLCRYCCYSGIYKQHRTHGSSGTAISLERVQEIADFIEQHRAVNRQLYISIYGGEPFTNKSILKKAVEYLIEKFPGVDLTISTNLVNFNEDDARWCIDKNITLNVSFDGCREVHDRSRVDVNQSGTFDTVLKHLYLLFDLKPKYFEAQVNLLMVLATVDDLLPNAKFWGKEPLLKTKEPFLIAGISPNYPDVAIVDEDHVKEKLYELLDYYEHNRDNRYCDAYFSQLTLPILNREVYDLDFNPSGLVCLPDNKRCFIDTEGQIGICEKCGDTLRIGSLLHGFDIAKINQLVTDFTEWKQEHCALCEVARLCQTCFSSSHLSDADWEIDCQNNLLWTRIAMLFTAEMSERKMLPSEDALKCHLDTLTPSTSSEVLRIMGNKHVIQHIIDFSELKCLSEAEKFVTLLQDCVELGNPGVLGIFHQDDGLIGIVGIDQIYSTDTMERCQTTYDAQCAHDANLFFVLDEAYWGRGIMTRMLSEYLSHHVNTVYYPNTNLNVKVHINSKNQAAIKLASRYSTLSQHIIYEN